MKPTAALALALVAVFALVGCRSGDDAGSSSAEVVDRGREADVAALLPAEGVVRLVPEVVAEVPHDPEAFTQGLEFHDGVLLEGTGLYGSSERRRVDPDTGEVLASVPLPDDHFGEGLTVAGDRLIQLTWKEGVAHLADPTTLDALGVAAYAAEGWGACFDGQDVVTSDGSSTLAVRQPDSLAVRSRVAVTLDGVPVDHLNELECADGVVWANVWLTSDIVAIDPATGRIRAVVDASDLVPDGVDDDAVLNGIARRPGGHTFWLTGKRWPVLYEVRLVPAS